MSARKPCTECGAPSRARGLCNRHYHRLRHTLPPRPQPPTIEALAEDAQWLLDTGESWHLIAKRLGVHHGALMSRLRQHGYTEIADRIAVLGRAVHEHVMSGSRK